jgi:hypothetical protein
LRREPLKIWRQFSPKKPSAANKNFKAALVKQARNGSVAFKKIIIKKPRTKMPGSFVVQLA